jgi:hypothetical protein
VDIVIVPDTQSKKGVPHEHLRALGNYIVQHKPTHVVHLGDHWDMASLAAYDRPGSRAALNFGNYRDDIETGKTAMVELVQPIIAEARKCARNKKRIWLPKMYFCVGNHEHRIQRFIDDDVRRVGMISLEDLNLESYGWEVIPFLHELVLNGVHFSHYFCNPVSGFKGKSMGGTADFKLMRLGFSFVQGHQQNYQYGTIYNTDGSVRQGLVCGSFYAHPEHYLGPQGNHHYRGAFHLHDVKDGGWRHEELPLNYLLSEYL